MKVILYMATTANGFIARADNSVAWSDVEWQEYARVLKDVGAYIVGATTYQMMKEDNEFDRIGNPAMCVLTHSAKEDDGRVMFAVTPEEALSKLGGRGFTKVIVGGGTQCNAAFLKAGLVDEIILDIEPMLFGHGLPLLFQCALEVPLELIETKKLSENELQVHYRVVKEIL